MNQAVIFVGHGGVPTDFPRREVMELKRLEGERHRTGGAMTDAEALLDAKLRMWPRTCETDPYLAGFESLAKALRDALGEVVFTAYNEFCTPTVEQAIEAARGNGYTDLVVITSMLTPGGSHAALEIPELLDVCRARFPDLSIHYAWPFAATDIATFLASHIKKARSPSH